MRIIVSPEPVTFARTSAMLISPDQSLDGTALCRLQVMAKGEGQMDGHLILFKNTHPAEHAALVPYLPTALLAHEAAHCFDPLLAQKGLNAYLPAEGFADVVMALVALSEGERAFLGAMAQFRAAHPQGDGQSSAGAIMALLSAPEPELQDSFQSVTGRRLDAEAGFSDHLNYAVALRAHPEWRYLMLLRGIN